MTPLVKALLAVALVVPLVAYVAGSLAGNGGETPEQQGTVFIDDVEPASETTSPAPRAHVRARRPLRPGPRPQGTISRRRRRATTPRRQGGQGRDPRPVEDDDDERDDDQDDDTDDGDDTDD